MKNFLSVKDAGNINELVADALQFKADPFLAKSIGSGKRIGLLFLNPSLRTRISTQVAASNLGMESIVFNVDKEGWKLEFVEDAVMNGDTVEHIKEAAPVLGQYFDILAIRTFPELKSFEADYSEHILSQFVKHCGVPVVSLESATRHPLQSLADIITMQEVMIAEKIQHRPKVVLSWAPHVKALPQCVANSFAEWVSAWGSADLVIAHPEGYALDKQFTEGATITHNQEEALANADFVYVKNWSTVFPYGQVSCFDQSWMLTEDSLNHAPSARIMHCLPVRRNVELSGELLDSKRSLVTQEAGNRVFAAQSVLHQILKG